MASTRLRLRDFRTYAAAEIALGPGLTVVHGPNGAGKTNLLEALYFGCTGALVPHRQRPRDGALRPRRLRVSRLTRPTGTVRTRSASASSPGAAKRIKSTARRRSA